MKITATIQARMSSSRLPGKVLKKICGKPIIEWQIDRINKSILIDEVIVATTENKKDKLIIDLCKSKNVNYWVGSENDVLGRINDAFCSTDSDIHVELYGDSPFIDPSIIDIYLGYFLKKYDQIDVLTNTLKTTFPPGNEFVIYKKECLLYANNQTDKIDPLREHVSLNIINKNKFKVHNIEAIGLFKKPNLFLEIDTIEDFLMLEKLIPIVISKRGMDFTLKDIIEVSKKEKDLIKQNINVKRRWKKFRKK